MNLTEAHLLLLERFLSEELAEWDKKFTAKFGEVNNPSPRSGTQ